MAGASADAFAAEALAFGTAVAREDEGKEEEAPGSPAEKVAKAAVAAKGPLVELDLSKLQELFVDIVGKVGEVGANQDKLANEIQTNKDELTELGVVVAGAARSQEHRALEDRVNELFDKLHALKTETELGLQGLVADFKAFKEAEENSKGRSGALERSLLDEALGTARNARDAAHSAHNHAENVRKTAEALTSRVDALEANASNYATKGDAAAALEAAHDARAHSERVLETCAHILLGDLFKAQIRKALGRRALVAACRFLSTYAQTVDGLVWRFTDQAKRVAQLRASKGPGCGRFGVSRSADASQYGSLVEARLACDQNGPRRGAAFVCDALLAAALADFTCGEWPDDGAVLDARAPESSDVVAAAREALVRAAAVAFFSVVFVLCKSRSV